MTTRIGKFNYSTTNVTTSWVKVLSANDQRKFATIVNASDEVMWLKNAEEAPVTAAATGVHIAAAGFAYTIDEDNLWKGNVWMIHAGTGNKVASVEEGV